MTSVQIAANPMTGNPFDRKGSPRHHGLLRQALASARARLPLPQPVIVATDFEILRAVTANIDQPCAQQPRQRPHRLAILIDEARFRTDPALLHSDTVWLEDRIHDWDFRNNMLYYYGHAVRIGQVCDLVAIYHEESRIPPLYSHA